MPDLEVVCPHCDLLIEADEDMAGEMIECPDCLGRVTLPLPAPKAPKLKKKKKKKQAAATEKVVAAESSHPPQKTAETSDADDDEVMDVVRTDQEGNPIAAELAVAAPTPKKTIYRKPATQRTGTSNQSSTTSGFAPRSRKKKKRSIPVIALTILGATLIFGGLFAPITKWMFIVPVGQLNTTTTTSLSYFLGDSTSHQYAIEALKKADQAAFSAQFLTFEKIYASTTSFIRMPISVTGHIFLILIPAIIAVALPFTRYTKLLWIPFTIILLKLFDDLIWLGVIRGKVHASIHSLKETGRSIMGEAALGQDLVSAFQFDLSLSWGWALLFFGLLMIGIAWAIEISRS